MRPAWAELFQDLTQLLKTGQCVEHRIAKQPKIRIVAFFDGSRREGEYA
jgi:hypothetical protein